MADGGNFKEQFDGYCTKNKEMTCKDLTKMLTVAGLIGKGGMKFVSNDVDIAFATVKGKEGKKGANCTLNYDQICKVLTNLCSRKGDKADAALENAYKCLCAMQSKDAGLQKKTQQMTATNDSVKTLTDTSTYTGAHKSRFGEDGKGKGVEGRVDRADTSGYVGNYKGQDTFDKK